MTKIYKIPCFLYSRTKRKDYRFLTSNDGFVDSKQLNACLEKNSKRLGKKEVLFVFETFGEFTYFILLFRTASSDERGRKIDAVFGFDLSNKAPDLVTSEFVSEVLVNIKPVIDTANFLTTNLKHNELGDLEYSYEDSTFSLDKAEIEIEEEKPPFFKLGRPKEVKIENCKECDLASKHFYRLPELPSSYKNFEIPTTMINSSVAKKALQTKNGHHFNGWPAGIYSSGFSKLLGEVRKING